MFTAETLSWKRRNWNLLLCWLYLFLCVPTLSPRLQKKSYSMSSIL